jgi:putative ABC transport system ATP-binding protein
MPPPARSATLAPDHSRDGNGVDDEMAATVRAAPEAVVSAVGLVKVYGQGETRVTALDGVDVVPTLTALENITLPMDVAGRQPDRELLAAVVDAVGLGDRLGHRPVELSGGQQQRVACARALASGPRVVFADEPTGNLDSRSGAEVLGFLRRAADELGQTIVMVTHDPVAAASADRVVFLADGRVVDELGRPTADRVLERMKRLDRRGS